MKEQNRTEFLLEKTFKVLNKKPVVHLNLSFVNFQGAQGVKRLSHKLVHDWHERSHCVVT